MRRRNGEKKQEKTEEVVKTAGKLNAYSYLETNLD